MNDLAIRVDKLSKRYKIGRAQQRQDTIREALTTGFRSLERRSRRENGSTETIEDTIWALRDVSFEVKQGEVVGIIGRNGAGKSTLLKILSRVTKPTTGRALVNGRMGSLLEVGTGFHDELTGRENIFLSGAILGMRKVEIERKFDEILEFSGVEKFIDTPIKRYSSGMKVRLGFAVAAHLEPEILLVDEVLAVGDAAFQKKSLGKMEDVAQEGRTVLFVSHNMVAMQNLCKRAIWLHNGKINLEGKPLEVVSNYLHSNVSLQTERVWEDKETAPGNEQVRLHRVRVQSENGSEPDFIDTEKPFRIEVEYWNLDPGAHLHVTLHFYTEQQVVAFTSGSAVDPEWRGRSFPSGLFKSVCYVPGQLLNSGNYRILLLVVRDGSQIIYRHDDLIMFDVKDTGKRSGAWYGKEPGAVRPILNWTTTYLDEPISEK